MKKKILKSLSALFLVAIVTSCGGGMKMDKDMPAEEREVAMKLEKSLPFGDKIEGCRVVKSKLPLAMLEGEYKGVRDQVNKARLDYRACMTRGLNDAAQKQVEILKQVQDMILAKDSNINATSPEYLFVLADVEEKTRRDGKYTGFIGVYDASTLEQVDLVQVTSLLYNNAIMMTEAQNGKLADPSTFTEDGSTLTSSNPVTAFILESDPK